MKAIENRARGSAAQHQGGALNKGNTESHAEKKSGWQTKKFGEVLEIRNGRNQREVESADGEFPIYGSAGNVMGMATDYICEGGTTIIGRKGNINSPIYADTRFWNVDTAFGLTAKACMNSRFLYFFCLSYDFSAHNRGTTIPSLVKSELLNIPIPVPPLAEQQRIVGLLDEAFEGLATAKANAEKNLQNARALFESHLQSVFTQRGPGWVEKNLGDLCQIKTGKKDVNEGNPEGKYPFFTCAAAHTFSDNYSFDTEALLVAGNGNVGQVSYYSGKFEAYQRTYVLFDFKGVTAKYLFRVLDKRLSATVSKQKLGNTMPYIKIGMLTDFVVPVPPPKEQALVAEHLNAFAEETQRLARLYEQKLAALEALKKSLLHQAFTGKLQRLLD